MSTIDEVKARIDTITTFPQETERPRVFIPESATTGKFQLLRIAVTGDLNRDDLLQVARRVQQDLARQALAERRRRHPARVAEQRVLALDPDLLAVLERHRARVSLRPIREGF